eukprot:366062-Chlamydomonas_euryale.AAC.1
MGVASNGQPCVQAAVACMRKGEQACCKGRNVDWPTLLPSPPPSLRRCTQVGCGADELIDLLMRCVLDPGDAIIDCPPTFTMYAFDADVNDARVVTVPRVDGFRVNVPAVKAAVEKHKPKIVFVTSPNNPDGSMMPDEEVRRGRGSSL